MEVGFWEPPQTGQFDAIQDEGEQDPEALKAALSRIGKPLDLPKYRERIAQVLDGQPQVSLRELVDRYPIESGIVDVVAYVAVGGEGDQNIHLPETFQLDLNRPQQPRYAELEKIIFVK
jgi:hypothetical protein